MFARFLLQLRDAHGEAAAGLSVLTLTELAHGIERAKVEAHCKHRQAFLDDLIADIRIYPVTAAIAQLAGKLSGQQANRGIVLPFFVRFQAARESRSEGQSRAVGKYYPGFRVCGDLCHDSNAARSTTSRSFCRSQCPQPKRFGYPWSVPPSSRKGALNLYVQSAHVRGNSGSKQRHNPPIAFHFILHNTLNKIDIREPQ